MRIKNHIRQKKDISEKTKMQLANNIKKKITKFDIKPEDIKFSLSPNFYTTGFTLVGTNMTTTAKCILIFKDINIKKSLIIMFMGFILFYLKRRSMNRLFFLSLSLFALFPNISFGQFVSDKLIISNTDTINYLIYFPEDYKIDSSFNYPLVLSLHGGGESGRDINILRTAGIPKLIEEGRKYPFILLAPQNPHYLRFWETENVMTLLREVIKKNRVDTNRIYLTGFSRGAYACWVLTMEYHNTFAAVIPISGAAPASYAIWVDKIPIWVFHGRDDELIMVDESINIVKRLQKYGHDPKITIYENTGHNAWDTTYNNPQVIEWLLLQKKKSVSVPPHGRPK